MGSERDGVRLNKEIKSKCSFVKAVGGVLTIHFYVSFKSSAVSLVAAVAYGRDLSVCLGPGTLTRLSPPCSFLSVL